MKTNEWIKEVEDLVQGMKDGFLSPEDFMMRLNELYEKAQG